MTIIDTLITDRTEADVKALEALTARINAGTATAEDWAEFLAPGNKGGYNYEDLNRVGTAVEYLAGRLNATGYSVTVQPKTDWVEADNPTPAQMADYLLQVQVLRDAFAVLPTTPELPADMEGLTFTEANDIERILSDIDRLITNMAAAWFYSGDLFSGEV